MAKTDLNSTQKYQYTNFRGVTGRNFGDPTQDLDAVNKRSTPSIITDTVVPSITPHKIGDIYINTITKKIYISSGTSSSADWNILN